MPMPGKTRGRLFQETAIGGSAVLANAATQALSVEQSARAVAAPAAMIYTLFCNPTRNMEE